MERQRERGQEREMAKSNGVEPMSGERSLLKVSVEVEEVEVEVEEKVRRREM